MSESPELVQHVFQPIADLQRGRACGYELLSRFPAPPTSSPAAWFNAAQDYGFAGPLESALLTRALSRRDTLPPNCFMSINLSPAAIVSAEVQKVFGSGQNLHGVVVELTERVPVGDYPELQRALAPARSAGASLAIDDVGAGYASLRHVMTLRPHFIKLDRSIVADIDRDEIRAAVVETVGVLADRTDAWIVAEGVERRAELDVLLALGVPLAQGFGLGRPAATPDPLEADVSEYLKARDVTPGQAVATVATVVESGVTVLHDDALAVERVLRADPGLDSVVVLDEHSRPLALAERISGTTSRTGYVTRVNRETPVGDAARLAMTRPREQRLHPLVCCGEQGQFVGLVRVESLVRRLAGFHPKETAGGRRFPAELSARMPS